MELADCYLPKVRVNMSYYIGNAPYSTVAKRNPDKFAGDGTTVNFTLSYAVSSPDDIFVKVSGLDQPTFSYNVSGTSLILTEAPPKPDIPSEGSYNIEVRYR